VLHLEALPARPGAAVVPPLALAATVGVGDLDVDRDRHDAQVLDRDLARVRRTLGRLAVDHPALRAAPEHSLGLPLDAAADRLHAQIGRARLVERRLEEPVQILAGPLLERRDQVRLARMGEGVLLCIAAQRGQEALAADHLLQGAHQAGGLAVGGGGVVVERGELERALRGRIRDLAIRPVHGRLHGEVVGVQAPPVEKAGLVAVQGVHDQAVDVLVHSLVEPCLVHLVGGQDALQPVVADLVDGDELGQPRAVRHEDRVAAGGDEGRVLHAGCAAGVRRRIDDAHARPRVRHQELAELLDRADSGRQVALGELALLRPEVDAHLHLAVRGAGHAGDRLQEWIRGPHEVVHRLGPVLERAGGVRVVAHLDQHAGGGDDVGVRHGQ
jgi:hypothetical protein